MEGVKKVFSEREISLIKEKYNAGWSQSRIGEFLGCDRGVVRRKIYQMLELGEIKERQTVRAANKRVDVKLQILIEAYKEGHTNAEIAEMTGLHENTVAKYAVQLRKQGIVQKERQKKPRESKKNNSLHPENRIKVKKQVPSTLKEGECVFCNEKISAQCIYGVDGYSEGGLCRYFNCTGITRNSLGVKSSACTLFSKISNDNPRKESIRD